MKLKFKINYYTSLGQNVFVCGSCEELGNDNPTEARPLNYIADGNWEAEIDIDAKKNLQLSYKYLIKDTSEVHPDWEWGEARVLTLEKIAPKVILEDAWRPARDIENALFTQAFAGNLFKRVHPKAGKKIKNANCRLQLLAPRIAKH